MIEKKVHSKKARMMLASTKIKFMLDLAKCVSDQTGMAEWVGLPGRRYSMWRKANGRVKFTL